MSRPVSLTDFRRNSRGCIQALKDAAGEEVLANAAGIIAMFTAMTMVVDAPRPWASEDGWEVWKMEVVIGSKIHG